MLSCVSTTPISKAGWVWAETSGNLFSHCVFSSLVLNNSSQVYEYNYIKTKKMRCNYKIQTSCFVRFSLHSAGRPWIRSHWGVLWGVLQITLFFSPLSHNPLHLTLFILLALKLLNTYILTHTLTVTDLEPSQTPGETSSSCWWIFNSRCCSGSSAPLRERGMKSQGAPLQCTR